MANDYGTGISRTLQAFGRQFTNVLFAKGKPPLDAELNLQDDISSEQVRNLLRSQAPSGWLTDSVNTPDDFVTAKNWSNLIYLGRPGAGTDPLSTSGDTESVVWAVVDGLVVPVTGTMVANTVSNQIRLYPAPDTDSRIDLVFLEVWRAQVSPNPSTVNKPAADSLYAYGNVEYGGSNFTDDLEDPAIGFETTERVQIQYRLRVFGSGAGSGSGVALDAYPDGLDDPNVLGQGTASSPQAGFSFTNQRLNGDAGLWRAGDGDASNALGTVDGYVYSVPICAVFRRNRTTFVAVSSSGNPNQNGSYDRNRSASLLTDPRDGAKAFTTPTLTGDLAADTTGVVSITDLVGSALADSEFISDLGSSTRFLVLGEGASQEIIEISAVDNTGSPTTITISATGRGRGDTDARTWLAGTPIQIFLGRSDLRYADEIRSEDILDLRRSVTLGEWDYHRLLTHNLDLLFQNRLRSSYKQNGAGGDTEGSYLTEVSYMWSDGTPSSVPNHTELVDGPDGVRTVFSDSLAIQPGVATLVDADATTTSGFTTTTFDDGLSWDVNPGFQPTGWLNGSAAWSNGSVIFLHIGGSSGSVGARGSFATVGTGEGSVRFVTPEEYYKPFTSETRHPVTIRFNDQEATFVESSEDTSGEARPGPLYPRVESSFEKPFILLGGIIRTDLQITTGISTDSSLTNLTSGYAEVDVGIDFDATIADAALNGTRTLTEMLTAGGTDPTGENSEIYLILYGDDGNDVNNGVFQVVAAGTASPTHRVATGATSVVVKGLTQGWTAFTTGTGAGLTAEFRSQFTTSLDGGGLTSGRASAAVVFTDIENLDGGAGNPWNTANTGALALPASVTGKAVVSTTLQYGPGRGGFARIPSEINRVAMTTVNAAVLRQSVTVRDADFPVITGVPSTEVEFDADHVQLWNQLDNAAYRGARYAENARENEVFVDPGSRTLIFRPFQNKAMTLAAISAIGTGSLIGDPTYPAGSPSTGLIKDGAAVHTANPAIDPVSVSVPVPQEYMPNFGRQDIPFHLRTGSSDLFLSGINHLFTDTTADNSNPVFAIIGGPPTTGGVEPMLFQTGTSSGSEYGGYSTITHPNHPAYQARLVELPSEISEDTGRTMKGIQLPPYLGIARLYGVYERQDYIDKVVAIGGASVTIPGAFAADRITPKTSFPTNLLRTDATNGTLFILKDGAEDITGSTGDHTYVVPEAAMDISRIPTFTTGTSLNDYEYVVECVTFGFSRGFIDENNYVLARRLDGTATAVSAGDELISDMCIPAAASFGEQLYVVYNRVVYQGDPYMTRDGETRQVADFSTRYGQLAQSDAFEIGTPIQQYDASSDQVPETINARALEVLASVDFWTTMGTGKVGGKNHVGTEVDAGWVQGGNRLPDTATDPRFETRTRTFSSSPISTGVATAVVYIKSAAGFDTDTDDFSNVNIIVTKPDGTQVTVSTSLVPTTGTEADVAGLLAESIIVAPDLQDVLGATNIDHTLHLFSRVPGSLGNDIRVEFNFDDGTIGVEDALAFVTFRQGGTGYFLDPSVSELLQGGTDLPNGAGMGDSSVFFAGVTERLPLGVLVNDADFLHEAPLREGTTMNARMPALRDAGRDMPISAGGFSFSEIGEGGGQWILMSDGSIQRYAAYSDSVPTGTKRFRVNRGASVALIDGDRPCGPVRWSAGGFAPGAHPVLKGAVLVGRAMLVRNQYEEAFTVGSTGRKRSDGDELQMVITTQAIYGSPACVNEGLSLQGEISPTGYGDGYASADRYRLEGKPMEKGRAGNVESTDKELVPYRNSDEPNIDDGCP